MNSCDRALFPQLLGTMDGYPGPNFHLQLALVFGAAGGERRAGRISSICWGQWQEAGGRGTHGWIFSLTVNSGLKMCTY